jgi:uncharacterized protein (DUF1501 family)
VDATFQWKPKHVAHDHLPELQTVTERFGFDTHSNNFPAMKQHGAAMDPALAALIEDLAQSGLLKKTLVVMLSEFGRL